VSSGPASSHVRADHFADATRGLRVEGVTHSFGALRVLDDVSFETAAGEFLTLLGASGSGKTTLLRVIGGLVSPDQGRIHAGDRDISRLAPEARDIGFVFQNYALFPHLSVADNIAFPLTVRGIGRAEMAQRVEEALSTVSLQGLADRYPAQLSGGQQQRVALARAIVFRPAMLLLDEPLGALDRQLRQQLAVELRALQRQTGMTMVYVTHDQEEAFTMSTRIAVMRTGRIEQLATPGDVYARPANLAVARFVGDLNMGTCRLRGREGDIVALETPDGTILTSLPRQSLAKRMIWAVRPEHLHVLPASGQSRANALSARVTTVIFGGSWHRIEFVLPSGLNLHSEGRGEPDGIVEGQEVAVGFDPARVMVFPEEQ
jgi:heme ABC exporter ATP-binding subunit CcmA